MTTFNHHQATQELYLIMNPHFSEQSGNGDRYLSLARQLTLWRLMYHGEFKSFEGPVELRSATSREVVVYRRLIARLRSKAVQSVQWENTNFSFRSYQ